VRARTGQVGPSAARPACHPVQSPNRAPESIMSRSHPASKYLAVLALLTAVPAAAVDYCVGTPGQLQNALDDAETDGADSVIKLRSGTYNLSADVRYETLLEYIVPAGKLTLRGGYNADCSSVSQALGATTIDGGGQRLLRLYTRTGSVAVVGLTLRNGWIDLSDGVFTECLSSAPWFSFRRLRIEQGSIGVTALCHDVVMENVLVSNGIDRPDGPFAADTGIGVYLVNDDDLADDPSTLTIVNSTIANGRLDVTNCCDGVSTVRLYNSIFDRPAGADIRSEAHVYARHNRYDGISLSNGAQVLLGSGENSAANTNLNAQFVPNPGSAMVNSGTGTVPDGLPDTDLAGGERVIGPRVDRGALESPVDGTGVYVVTNTNATGNGSLAQALALANAEAGTNVIRFNIAGSCPHRITLTGSLQVHESVNFDGWSEPGSVRNSDELGWNGVPCVILDGGGSVGIGIETMGDLGAAEGSITVRGLAFERFALAISLAFGENHAIYGNQFGGRIGSAGPVLRGNQQAIALVGGGRSYVGNYGAETRNLIGGSSDVGVLITTFLGLGGDDNRVINNLIGLDKNAATALANGTGIRINGGFNRIVENRISGNLQDGILLSGINAEDNVVIDNWIGGGIESISLTAGNGRMGIMVQNEAHDNVIGPNNRIGRNGDDGVRIMPTAGGRNRITGNRISRNSALGIDLDGNGVSANDLDPQFCGPDFGCLANRGQNFPILASATRRTTGFHPVDRPIELKGTLRSTVGGPYRIEVFAGASCEANGHGEGYRMIASANLSIPNAAYCPVPGGVCFACASGNCTAGFTTWLPELDLDVGEVVTATATSASGDTSEFSACTEVVLEANNDLIFANGFQN
jgi:hypothetical protein